MRPANILDAPILPPGICIRCRCAKTVNRDYFLDTGVEIDYEGVIYFCEHCLKDFVTVAPDCFTKKEMDAVIAANTDMYEAASKGAAEYREIREALKGIGLDADLLLETARNYKKDLDATPALRKELAESKLETQVQKALVTSAESKLEALTQYVGSEHEIERLRSEIDRLTVVNKSYEADREMFAETLARVTQENSPLEEAQAMLAEIDSEEEPKRIVVDTQYIVEEVTEPIDIDSFMPDGPEIEDPDWDLTPEERAARLSADVPTPVKEEEPADSGILSLNIGDIVVPK